jgi:leader peptidase (prepilin peptidase)/N-methyltransferase
MSVLEFLSSSPTAFIGTCLLVGLVVGSFLNVVVYRVPVMLEHQWRQQCAELAAPTSGSNVAPGPEAATRFNLIVPRSACPACKAPLTALQNVPVLSYLFLKGRCAHCGVRISIRYPLVEALTSVLSATVAWKYGYGWPTVAAIVLTWFLVALTFIDLDHQLLPDNMTLPLVWLGLFLSLWGPQPGAAPVPVDMHSSLVGAMAGYLSLWSVYHLFRLLTGKEGMGYGDFKLFAALGAWMGWKMLLPIILIAAVFGAASGIALIAFRGRSRSVPIAFGPFLAAAGWLMLMFGPELVTSYLRLYVPRP